MSEFSIGENNSIEIYQSGHLLVLRYLHDQKDREPNGNLTNPPIILVIVDDAEQGEVRFERVSWGLAQLLAPVDCGRLTVRVNAKRSAEFKAETWLKQSSPEELRELAKLVSEELRQKTA